MIITSGDLLKGINGKVHNILYKEILTSLTHETIHSENRGDDGYIYDVKLLVNGIAIEPQLLTRLLEKIESYIDKEAKALISDKITTSIDNFESKLLDILDEVKGHANELNEVLNKLV